MRASPCVGDSNIVVLLDRVSFSLFHRADPEVTRRFNVSYLRRILRLASRGNCEMTTWNSGQENSMLYLKTRSSVGGGIKLKELVLDNDNDIL